ncbi:BlaI/MecI/CopY family transcriptional regulator [Gimesia sp.]|uniref:BlaI/MecI/CopY family transcriptional regulator n=1 Tax=Gimesia sp. TaxID=2024833 RepID=UPI0032EF5FDB
MAKNSRSGHSDSQDLPEAELEVLACLWNAGALTAGEIRNQLESYRPMAHGSVLTLLNRLSEKKFVKREKSGQGKSFTYRAARGPESTHRRILQKLRQRIFGGNSVAIVASLLESHPTSPEEIEELKALIERLEQNQKLEDK